MSADNGYYVAKVNDGSLGSSYGVFYYIGDDTHAPLYSYDRAKAVFNDPVAAIIMAHEMEREDHTEYGISVQHEVLDGISYIGLTDSRIK